MRGRCLGLFSCFLFRPALLIFIYRLGFAGSLFSLMAVMKGFQKAGVFLYLGGRMGGLFKSVMLILVFLPFIFSMFITNDVAFNHLCALWPYCFENGRYGKMGGAFGCASDSRG